MLQLFVVGATGRTGQRLVSAALDRGHRVTAFARDPSKLPEREHLTAVRWRPEDDVDGVAAALRGHDAVISALGVPAFASGGLIERSMRLLVPAMQAAGVRRLVLTSAFGLRDPREAPLIPRLFRWAMLREVYADKAAGEAIVHASDLDWTVVYPTMLVDGPATGRIRFGESLALPSLPKVSCGDLAVFLLDRVADSASVRQGLLVTTA